MTYLTASQFCSQLQLDGIEHCQKLTFVDLTANTISCLGDSQAHII